MAKFSNFKLGDYDKLWSSADKQYLQKFITEASMLETRYGFAYRHFRVANLPSATDMSGTAMFRTLVVKKSANAMADFRAPLADTSQVNKDGFKENIGTIPDLGKGFQETATERYQKEKLFKQFGKDNDIIQQYIDTLQKTKDSLDARISNMAGQVLSTGNILGRNSDNGTLWYEHYTPIEAAQRVKAGTLPWTDPDCDLFSQMRDIETAYRDRTEDDQPLKWNVTDKTWRNIFLKNQKLIDNVMNYRKIALKPYDMNGTVTEEWVNEYLVAVGLISPIQVIYEGGVEETLTNRRSVSGWADNIAVLRPTGDAGIIQHSPVLDGYFAKNYKSPTVEKSVASLGDSGFMTLINTVRDNGGLPEWHTDLLCTAVPTLDKYPSMTFVTIDEAS